MSSTVMLFLTCANAQEANAITRSLLEKRLIVCAKSIPASARFLWEGKIDEAVEILLMMESVAENFTTIEQEVRALHSYQMFVLLAIPVLRASADTERWIVESCKKDIEKG